MKKVFITGITGQDGAYLTHFLLQKGYEVHGLKRRSSLLNTDRIDPLFHDLHEKGQKFYLHHGDLTDSSSLLRVLAEVRPHEIYNLAAQSHVAVSFETPEYTANSDGLGTLRLLDALRTLNMAQHARFYQASTSELYGKVRESPQNEQTPFYPRSPYAVAKLYAYWITVNYREAYGIHASNGILFNHESPLRGETFVTRKITRAVARIVLGMQSKLYMGNLNALRDWGHARDYAQMQWMILQQEKPDDYVIATGEQHSVREFLELSFAELDINLEWRGQGIKERGIIAALGAYGTESLQVGQEVVAVDPRYFRPTEVESLLGDASKARTQLGWSPKISFSELVSEMVRADYEIAIRYQKAGGKSLKVPDCLNGLP